MLTHCLRCNRPCQTGTPDPKARAMRRSATTGFCPDCIVTWFILSIEPMRMVIEGTPQRGSAEAGLIVPARPGLGPECLLGEHIQKTWAPVLAPTQIRPDEINWINVVSNWGLPFPKNRQPQPGAAF